MKTLDECIRDFYSVYEKEKKKLEKEEIKEGKSQGVKRKSVTEKESKPKRILHSKFNRIQTATYSLVKGYNVKVGKHLCEQSGYLRNTPRISLSYAKGKFTHKNGLYVLILFYQDKIKLTLTQGIEGYKEEFGLNDSEAKSGLESRSNYLRKKSRLKREKGFTWKNGDIGVMFKYYDPSGLESLHEDLNHILKIYYVTNQNYIAKVENLIQDEDEGATYTEGKEKYAIHKNYERIKALSKKKKHQALNDNKLKCEVCNFDFFKAYGDRGFGYIECHHNKPLSEMGGESEVKLEDLSLLCSNCHRIIHRAKPYISVKILKDICGLNSYLKKRT